MAYDNMGRLIGTTTTYSFLPSSPFSNAYAYDAGSNRKTLTLPDSSSDTYAYDTLNRLSSITDSITGAFTFGYDGLSRRTQLTRPNGVNTNYSYDSLSHLLSVLHQTSSATLDGATYTYDPAGNRTSKANQLNGVTEQYTYDPLYQLTQVVQGATTTESYSYDGVGNRLSSVGVSSYTYNASNQLTSTSATSFTYDNNGNTLTKTDSTGTRTYTWDFENRLASVALPGTSGTVTFKYDPFGRRIQKAFTQNSTTTVTNYLYDGVNSIEEVDSNNNELARYSQGVHIDEPLAERRSGTIVFYEQDGLGSITSLSGSTPALQNSYTYDAFGNLTVSTGSLANPFQFAGRDYDPETGLRYYRARYFDPTAGRFLSQDPLRFAAGYNFYMFVRNNPVMLTDPLGLRPGDKYPTRDCAGYDAVADINWLGLIMGWEYGGTVYQNLDGTYSYTPPITAGLPDAVNVAPPYVVLPPDVYISGFYHTHPLGNWPGVPYPFYDNEQLSTTDRWLPLTAMLNFKTQEIPAAYLGTPNGFDFGFVKKYVPDPSDPSGTLDGTAGTNSQVYGTQCRCKGK
jgi:RHS repeat-associated protein